MTGIFSARNLTLLAPVPRQRVGKRYAIAIATAILAVLLRWILDPVLGQVAFYVTLYATVTFCAVVCGFAPAIVSAFSASWESFTSSSIPATPCPSWASQKSPPSSVASSSVAVLIALGEAYRRKQLRLNETILALTTEAHERKRAEDQQRQAHDEWSSESSSAQQSCRRRWPDLNLKSASAKRRKNSCAICHSAS